MPDFAFSPPVKASAAGGIPKPPVVPIPTPVDAVNPESVGVEPRPKVG